MNAQELAQRLHEEGCNPNLYAVDTRAGASDAYCLTRKGAQWQVYYTERGQDSAPIYASEDEAQACAFFFQHIMGMRHEHCVGFFVSKANAEVLQTRLADVGVAARIDRIPWGGPDDPRFRVFVTGKAIFIARRELGEIPVRDAGA